MIVFRPSPPAPRTFFAISFQGASKIRLVDAPNDSVVQAFERTAAVRPSLIASRPG